MPTLTRPYEPTLRLRQRERSAIACLDGAGNLHWVRVFDGTIQLRPGGHWGAACSRLETPDGSPVCHVDGGLYLIWSRDVAEWLEVESLA